MADNTITYIMAGVILVLAYFLYTGQTINIGGGESQTGLVTHTNLQVYFQPYIAQTNIAATCSDFGGQWFNTPDKVGCFSTVSQIPGATCGTPQYTAAKNACLNVGATPVCNGNNLGCVYT